VIIINTLVIKQKLPSLNDTLRYNRTNKYLGAQFKKEIEEAIGWAIRQALTSKKLHKVTQPVIINIKWHEKSKRRDVDNIQSSQKFILDALVKKGVLIDDNRNYVKQIHHEVIDDVRDYVEVELMEV
jgi:Holliday junction resolvase RusA-like endonuclease